MIDMKAQFLRKYGSVIVSCTIFAGGLFLRLQRILMKVVWGEEAIYLEVARDHTLKQLILVKHWLIDHPQLYLIFLHFWSKVGTSPFLIRLPNLAAYLVSFCFIFQIGKLVFKNHYLTYLLLAIYAFFPYYLGIDWQAVPYSMAMMFFLGSMFYLLKLIWGDQSNFSLVLLSIFLTLFLYTSFESIYFFASIIFFLFVSRLFSLLKSEIIMKVLLSFLISLLLFSPEILLVLTRVAEFPNLSLGLISGDNSIVMFLSNLFALTKFGSLELFGLCVTLVLLAVFLLRDGEVKNPLFAVLTSLVISPTLIYVISKSFFEVRHPRGYYFIVFEIFLTTLMMFDLSLRKSKVIKWSSVVLLIVLALNYVARVDSVWLRDEYMHSQPYREVIELRSKLVSLINRVKAEDKSVLLLLDNNIVTGDWYEGVYLYEYYFKCLDLRNTSTCRSIREVITLDNMRDAVVVPKHDVVIGIMVSGDTSKYFLKYLCEPYEECYVWNFKYHEFRMLYPR